MKLASNMMVLGGFFAVTLLFGCANDSGKEDSLNDNDAAETKDTVSPKESRPISEISDETELKEQDCEDKFKNEHGVCEVPNPEYPKELIEKKYKEDDQDKETDSDQ